MAKVTRRKLMELAEAIDGVGGLSGIKFCYGVMKNSKQIMPELEALATGLKHSKRFKEYNEKRLELCEKMAKKDENGKPIKVPLPEQGRGAMTYVFTSQVEFDKELDKLREEYKGELEERKKLVEEYEVALDEEIDMDYYMIEFSDVPENITSKQLNGISDLIADIKEATDKKKVKKGEEKEKEESGEEE